MRKSQRKEKTGEKGKAPKSFGKRLKKDLRHNAFAYLCILPVLLWYVLFCYVPMYGIVIAFQNYKPFLGINGSKWVGLQNFLEFFTGPFFLRTLKNTVMLNFWALAFGFTAPIILALLLNEVRTRWFKKTVQTITYMPHFISLVVACGIIRIFVAQDGIVTQLLNFLTGVEHTDLLSYENMFRPIYTFSGIWQAIGWDSIIYLSAMSSVDMDLYEAVKIDGGGRLACMWHVTLPQIRPTIVILLIFAVGGMMGSSYEKIILLYNPLIYEKADVIASYVYRMGLREARYGYASAVGLFSSVINFFLLWFTNYVSRKYSEISIF